MSQLVQPMSLRAFERPPLPRRFCNLDRVVHALEARNLDGIVVTSPQNVFYLTGFNTIAHKSDEPRVCAALVPAKPDGAGAGNADVGGSRGPGC